MDKNAIKAKYEAEKESLKQRSIKDVAESLGMQFDGIEWTEHRSFKLDLKKNTATWYSNDETWKNMDVFSLVMQMRNVKFKEAYQYVKTGEFGQVVVSKALKDPFVYHIEKYEDDSFNDGRAFLNSKRMLSDATIDFFIEQGVLSQSTRRTDISEVDSIKGQYYYDPVIVFKTLDRNRKIIGTSMVGIDPNQSIYDLPEKKIKRKQIAYNSDGLGGINVSIGTPNRIVVTEAPIDLMSYYELNKDRLDNVMLVALDGSTSKIPTVKRYVLDVLTDKKWSLNPDRSKLNDQFKLFLENTDVFQQRPDLITIAVDNDKAGLKMIKECQKQNIPIVVDLPPLHDGQTKNDWNDELKFLKNGNDLEHKKALDQGQEPNVRGEHSRNSDYLEGEPSRTASQPEEQTAPPDFPANVQLHFSIADSQKSIYKQGYHSITKSEVNRLNRFALSIQQTAKWYLDNLAGTNVNYLYKDGHDIKVMRTEFRHDNFSHLIGIAPIVNGEENMPAQTLIDLAEGKGEYDNLMVSNAIKDKTMVLPLLPDIVESKSFVFDDLSNIDKFSKIDLSKAIKTEDEDLLLAFRDVDGVGFPASIMRIKGNLKTSLQNDIEDKTILGVFREKYGKINMLSVNDDLIQDNGRELKTFLTNNQFEKVNEDIMDKNINKVTLEPTASSNQNIVDAINSKDTKALSEHLKNGINQYLDSSQYKLFLDAMSKFHRYSYKNIQLILAQNKNATLIASFNKWKKEFERSVLKGSKALKIWAPISYKAKDKDGKELLDKNSKPIIKEGFKLVPVFDVSQTDGKEIPKQIYELEEKMPRDDFVKLYKSIVATSPVPIKAIDPELYKGVNGFYVPEEKYIGISKGMSADHTIKTLIHEITHATLHTNSQARFGDNVYRKQEFEAESVAYIVSKHFGINSSDYSFGYLASWTRQGHDIKQFEKSLSTIQSQARELINKIDNSLSQIQSQNQTSEHTVDKKISKALETQKGFSQEIKKEQAVNRTSMKR